jgi:exodeoxyribonuclease VII large subunit
MLQDNLPHFTVSKISDIIKNTLEQTFPIVNIIGEVSNLSISTKSAFFSLKDSNALLRCVSWNPLNIKIEEGDSVVATGRITVYKGSSSYQLTVYKVEKQGIGNLAKAFQELKVKLEAQGLFNEKHKKPIPQFVQKIALISAENSAALEDVLVSLKTTIVQKTYFMPAIMQGKNCVASVISALKKAQTLPVEVIIIARGGGSFEDLNEFNNEELAREVFACNIPVVSAIGHEIDFTILDFVSDVRAPTPTAAAKMVALQKSEVLFKIEAHQKVINEKVKFEIYQLKKNVEFAEQKIAYVMQKKLYELKNRIDILSSKLCQQSFVKYLHKYSQKILLLEAKFMQINPQKVLSQGFALLKSGEKFYDNPALLPEKFEIITKNGEINAKKLDN